MKDSVVKSIRFRWWPIRRLLILPIVSARISAGIAVASFIVAVAGISVSVSGLIVRVTGLSPSELVDAGWVLAVLGIIAAAIYATDGLVRKFTMERTGYEKDARVVDFVNAPTLLPPDYRFVRPNRSREELYPYVDLSADSEYIQAANDLTRRQRSDLYHRWISICPRGFLHLERRVDSYWRPIAVSILLPLTLEGFAKITNPDKSEQTKVIDLGLGDIRDILDRRHPVLLIDTWVVDRRYRSTGHGKQPGIAGGWANALTLRHIAEFWNTGEKGMRQVRESIAAKKSLPNVTFLVETSNQYVSAILRALAFRSAGESKIGDDFYTAPRTTIKGLLPTEFERLATLIADLHKLPIHRGTAPKPRAW